MDKQFYLKKKKKTEIDKQLLRNSRYELEIKKSTNPFRLTGTASKLKLDLVFVNILYSL